MPHKLQQLKLTGMLRAVQEQKVVPDIRTIPFEERLGLMVGWELTGRYDNIMRQMAKANVIVMDDRG